MMRVAPEGRVSRAGALSGNRVAMAGALATLLDTSRPRFYEALEKRAARLVAGLRAAAERRGIAITAEYAGSMGGAYFTAGPVRNYEDAKQSDAAFFARWHKAALARGVFLAPSAFEAGFVSSALSDAGIHFTITQLDAALGEARGR